MSRFSEGRVGGLLVGSYDGRFYALDAGTGEARWTFAAVASWPHGEYSPAVAGDGQLYLVGYGQMYALRPK